MRHVGAGEYARFRGLSSPRLDLLTACRIICAPALNIIGGWSECEEQPCTLSGVQCEPHGSLAPLASEFVVASVERLDDGPANANDTLIATAAPPNPSTR